MAAGDGGQPFSFPTLAQEKHAGKGWEKLSDLSDKDKPWDRHRGNAQDVAGTYATAWEGWLRRYGERVEACSPWLGFQQGANPETGELALTLKRAYFCRVRHCPVCQWRRSLMWKARFLQALPDIEKQAPAARWIFLTLTRRNVPVEGLRNELTDMGQAWNRLRLRREFRDVLGWVRTVEITRGKDGNAHPHYHVLMLVKSTYFKPGHFVPTAEWSRVWREVGRLDYDPICDARAVRTRGENSIRDAVAETLKYSVKASDMKADPAWFLELTRQTFRTRAIASGGLLKDVFRDEAGQEDLLKPDGGEEEAATDEAPELRFTWSNEKRDYRRRRA